MTRRIEWLGRRSRYATTKAWLRAGWWRLVRGYDSEICHDCGRPVGIVWHAPDALWLDLMGSPAGILCVYCFDARADRAGLLLYWVSGRTISDMVSR